MADDRAKLLRSLAIDRGETEPSPPAKSARGKLLASGALVIATLATGLWYVLPQFSGGGRAERRVPVPVTTEPPAPHAPAPATEPRQAGGLSASGYVVARRKATVAAEITGRVVELFVDEGMVVRAGQVVARLDSVLAEADLTLAQSRAVAAEAAAAAVAADLDDAERILGRTRSLSQKNI